MCGRYYIDPEESDQIRTIIEEVECKQGNSEAHAAIKLGEIYPTNIVPVVTESGAELMKWGYSGYKNRVINARSETVFEKPMFRKPLLERRCLIPASGYYEWKRTQSGAKSKQKYALYRPGKPLFMAGVWRKEQNEALPVFVILTREASPVIAEIHDRMPVILPEDVQKEWVFGGDVEKLFGEAVNGLQFQLA